MILETKSNIFSFSCWVWLESKNKLDLGSTIFIYDIMAIITIKPKF